MENLTIGELLGYIGLVIGAYELISKGISILGKPLDKIKDMHNKDMKTLKEHIDELQDNKANRKDVEAIEKQLNLTLKIQLGLLEHAITGNHINNLEELKKEAQEFLINN